jgi:BlaI family penicillinase repressor
MKRKSSRKSPVDSQREEEALTRRERQIMDVVYASGSATARDIWQKLPDAPTYATVRTILRVLLEKKHLKFRKEGRTYVYLPVKPRDEVAYSAMKRLLKTFYDGSVEQAVSSMLGMQDKHLDLAELERIEQIIKRAKKKKAGTS